MIEEIGVLCKCGLCGTVWLEDGVMEGVRTAGIEKKRLEGLKGGNPDSKFYTEGDDIYHRGCPRQGICTLLGKERE